MPEYSTQADIDFDAETDTYRFEATGRGSVGTDIVFAMAEITGIEPFEMEPMATFLAEGVVARLFQRDRPLREEITFEYLDFHVRVTDEEVLLQVQSSPIWARQVG